MHTLEQEEASKDVACVRCHATALESGPEPDALVGFRVEESVSCSSCHGPGQTHIDDPRTDNIVGLGERCSECVIEEVCTQCHDATWDPGWDLKRRLRAAGH